MHTLLQCLILLAVSTPAPASDWQKATPESEGMSSEKLAVAKAFMAEQGTKAALILRHGKIIAEWYWDGAGPESDFDTFSTTKSVFGTAIGLLVEDGKLRLDDPAWKWIPECEQDGRKAITIFHLMNMISGLSSKAPPSLKEDANRLTLVLQQPLVYQPGTKYEYNSYAYDCLSTIVRQVSGMEASEFLRERLFEPIGMQHAKFGFFGGKTEPSGYLHLSARDGARFGYLFLRHGNWNGKQIVSSSWVQKVSRTSNDVNPHCSYLWWVNSAGYSEEKTLTPHGWKDLPRDTYSTTGRWGNNITVIPSLDLVIVRFVGAGKAELPPNDYCKLVLDSIITP
jgi:CubicO group peptidase (beta-lactamase class C family)